MKAMSLNRSEALVALLAVVMMLSGCKKDDAGPSAAAPAPTNNANVDRDQDGAMASNDCNDNDAAIINEVSYFVDHDLDGIGGAANTLLCSVKAPAGYSTQNTDCDDNQEDIQTPRSYYVDADGDGFGAGTAVQYCLLQPPTGYAVTNSDGDDNNAAITPSDSDGDLYANDVDCAPADPTRFQNLPFSYRDVDGDTYTVGGSGTICTGATLPTGYLSVAKGVDCNDNNKDAYVIADYFPDRDGDGLGEGVAFHICTASPTPPLNGFSTTDGDTCPDLRNHNRDWDKDGLDDVCDHQIIVTQSVSMTGTFYSSRIEHTVGYPNSYTHIEFRGGARLTVDTGAVVTFLNETKLAFKNGASLRVNPNSDLIFEGTAGLEMVRTEYNRPVQLDIGNHSSTSSPFNNRVNIIGRNHKGRFMFQGADISVGDYTTFDGIQILWLWTTELENTQTRLKELYGATLRQKMVFSSGSIYDRINKELRIKNSPGELAVMVDEQWVNFTNVHFENNSGYPINCRGKDYLRVVNDGSIHRQMTTCQNAQASAYFKDNRLNGVLLDTTMQLKSTENPQGTNQFRFQDPYETTAGQGTDKIYIGDVNYSISFSDNPISYSVQFQDVTLLPREKMIVDANGNIVGSTPNWGEYNPYSGNLRIGGSEYGNKTAQLTFYDSDLRNIKVIVVGGHLRTEDSQVGSIMVGDGYSQRMSPSVNIIDSVVDLQNSFYISKVKHNWDATPPNQKCGMLFYYNEDWSSPGYVTITNSQILGRSDAVPFCSLSESGSAIANSLSLSSTTLQDFGSSTLWLDFKTLSNVYGGFYQQ